MHTLKIRKIGNSAGVLLTGEVLEQLGVAVGDQLQLVPTEHGLEMRAYSSELAEEMELAEEFMDKYRSALRELAK